jgi:hypothetical protein
VNAVSVSPNTGSGATQAFTLTYTDSLGAADLASARVRFGASNVGPGTCTAWYDATTSTIKLMDDAGAWGAPVALGSGTLTNSQCALNLASSTATPNGSTLTLVLNITFTGAFSGAKNIYMLAASATGPGTGWIQRGTWTVTGLQAVSVTPSSGSGAASSFAATYLNAAGIDDFGYVYLRLGTTPSASGPANTCMVRYEPATRILALRTDSGAQWMPATIGAWSYLQNNQCLVIVGHSYAQTTDQTLTLTVDVQFANASVGALHTSLYATSLGGPVTGWQELGSWTVPAPVLTADSVLPSSGTGAQQTFEFQYTHASGAAQITSATASFAPSAFYGGFCSPSYTPSTNTLSLYNPSSGLTSSGVLGTVGTLTNPDCSIDLASSTAVVDGNTLTLTLPLTFTASFGGPKQIWMSALGSGATASSIHRGDWIVPGASLTLNQLQPGGVVTTASGRSQVFAGHYSASLGVADIAFAYMRIGSSVMNGCVILYDAVAGLLSLRSDAGPFLPGQPLGAPGTLQNSQCSIDLANSVAVTTPYTLELFVAATFSPSYAGSKPTGLLATDSGGFTAGWAPRSSWVVPGAISTDWLAPNWGMGDTQTFSAQYSNTQGVADIGFAYFRIGNLPTDIANNCTVRYEQATGQLSLSTDGGGWLPGVALPDNGTLENSQCAIALANSSVAVTENTITLRANVTFKAPFANHLWALYTSATTVGGATTDWRWKGEWRVP